MPFRHSSKLKRSINEFHQKQTIRRAKVFLNDQQFYSGEWLNNEKHGHGILTHQGNHWFYEGEFRHDKRHGHGRLTQMNEKNQWKRIYVGQWENDRWNGFGMHYINDESFYQGDFLDNQRHGWGTFVDDKGNLYEGQWLKNKREGLGRLITAVEGDRHVGSWSNDEKNGFGQIYYHRYRRCFQGQWSNGLCQSAKEILCHSTSAIENPAGLVDDLKNIIISSNSNRSTMSAAAE